VATLVRWGIVAVHTAFVASALLLMAQHHLRSDRSAVLLVTLLLAVFDLPVSILNFLLILAMRSVDLSSEVVFGTAAVFQLLLGCLLYYWLGGRIARSMVAAERRLPLTAARCALVGIIGLLLVSVVAALPWSKRLARYWQNLNRGDYAPPEVTFSGDSRNLQQSAVVPTLDSPLPEGKNVIWCATFQMAWDRLKNDVAGGPVRVTNAEALADRLNRAGLSAHDLPDNSYYAAAGFVEDGIVDTIRREMQTRFDKEPLGLDAAGNVIVAYAYLRASVPFALPYFENDEDFLFTDSQGRDTAVSSFGLRAKDKSAYDLREQVDILYTNHDDGADSRRGEPRSPVMEFALDLCRDSKPNQVIVACVPRQETLAATLQYMEQKTAAYPKDRYRHNLADESQLLVPNLNWSLDHHFAELEGADKQLLNRELQGTYIAAAMQTIDFRLDRSGVELDSEARVQAKSSRSKRPAHYLFNRPFLIVVKKRDAGQPFFVMWVDNAELLCKPQNK
jgi:hypothetical protein